MRKPVFPRIMLITILYCAVFIALVMIQFARQGGFTRTVGNFVVTGRYRVSEGDEIRGERGVYQLDGGVSVYSGGVEFCLSNEDAEDEIIIVKNTERIETYPDSMSVSGENAVFNLPDGTGIEFSVHYTGGTSELRIQTNFGEGVTSLEMPYHLMRRTGLRETGDGRFVTVVDGVDYSFGRSRLDTANNKLIFNETNPVASYGMVPEKKAFVAADFILPKAETPESYAAELTRWRDENFSLWNRIVASGATEDDVIAYADEALTRGTYRASIASVPQSFLNGSSRTYRSTVYLGRLTEYRRDLERTEREKLARLSRLINEKSPDLLKESHIIEYFAVRGHVNFVDETGVIIGALDPSTLTAGLAAGVLEGCEDWAQARPRDDNPFERLADQALFVISESLRRTPDGNCVLVFSGGGADPLYNLRLGRVMLARAVALGDEDRAAVARSIILSVLSLCDSSGGVRTHWVMSESGEIAKTTVKPEITAAILYEILSPGDFAPRALPIGASAAGIWTWTCAKSVSAQAPDNNTLDISVSFPSGETHYMIFRGIRAFTKLQLYNMDFRTDPQFERYDSSGWAYFAQEQTLIVKMKHRATVEHIRIFY